MWNDFAPLGPAIGIVMMINPSKQCVLTIFVQDNANVLVDSHRPKAR